MDNVNAYAELLLCLLLAPTLVTSDYPQMRKAWKALTGGFQQQPESPSWSGTLALWTLTSSTNPSVSTSR
jgi:hypothetical protein